MADKPCQQDFFVLSEIIPTARYNFSDYPSPSGRIIGNTHNDRYAE